MTSSTHDLRRNQFMLTGKFARKGYDWWWHSFTAHHEQTGAERAFFVEFFTCNPELGGPEPIFGMDAEGHRGTPPSYCMVKAGTWGEGAKQLHRFFAWDDVEIGRGAPYYVLADDCFACDTNLVGRVDVSAEDAAAHPEWMSDAGSIVFDLQLDKKFAFNVGYGASGPFRAMKSFEMFWHAEGIKTEVSGVVVLDGERYIVSPETSYGYSDKNWGSDFTSPWIWLASSNLTSRVTGKHLENTAFDLGGGRPVAFGIALDDKLLGLIQYEGRAFEFNFSKLWTGSQTRFDVHETDDAIVWHIEQETSKALMITDVTCPKAEMVLANYESPDGYKRHNRLFNGGTGTGRVQLFEKVGGKRVLVDDMDAANIGCEYGRYCEPDGEGK